MNMTGKYISTQYICETHKAAVLRVRCIAEPDILGGSQVLSLLVITYMNVV